MNLRNKSYCIFNQQYTKEEYQKKIKEYQLSSAIFLEGMRRKFDAFAQKFIVPNIVGHHNTEANGNWIENSKNVHRSFGCLNVENGRYLFSIFNAKDVMDYSHWGNISERIYESGSVGIQSAGVKFSNLCWNAVDFEYCSNCHSSRNLFG